ncbi:2OG-Fe(II) oxygenase [Halobacteriovorax sp. HFRX-2_2]|uniref:2OG-Fe(II) oxygenase n=1 Tax=Halobacteriovorax sp. HFRX-2_2 TaxID=3157717 RepID=UPI00371D8655
MQELDALIESLTEKRYYVSDTLISNELARALKDEAQTRFHIGDFQEAKVGRQLTKRLDERIRGDLTSWIEGDMAEHPLALQQYLKFLDNLKDQLNPIFYLGIRSYEGHFACYDEGAFYRKHVDQHRGRGLRRLSVILYLSDMGEADGGEVIIYHHERQDEEVTRIKPMLGRLLIFLSEDLPHEVLPAYKARLSLTGWLRA